MVDTAKTFLETAKVDLETVKAEIEEGEKEWAIRRCEDTMSALELVEKALDALKEWYKV